MPILTLDSLRHAAKKGRAASTKTSTTKKGRAASIRSSAYVTLGPPAAAIIVDKHSDPRVFAATLTHLEQDPGLAIVPIPTGAIRGALAAVARAAGQKPLRSIGACDRLIEIDEEPVPTATSAAPTAVGRAEGQKPLRHIRAYGRLIDTDDAPVAHTVPALHDPVSGRVHATRVAEFLGLSLSTLARLIDRSPQSVHKTPDAPALQEPLSVFARIATSLTRLFGTPEKARVWLNAPHPDLDQTPPVALLRARKAEVVAELLEDALLGHPS
jgi:hypothetical protein